MKVHIIDEAENNTFLSSVVFHCADDALMKVLCQKRDDKEMSDVILSVDGYELDIIAFLENLESQMDDMIKEEAVKLITDKFEDIQNFLFDLEERIKPELENRLKEWERG